MGSDASIYNLIRPQPVTPFIPPEERQAQQMRLRQLAGAQEMQDLQLGQARDGIARNRTLQDLFSQNPNASLEDVGRVDYAAMERLRKERAEAAGKDATTSKTKLEALEKALKIHKDQLSGVNDTETAARWVAAGFNDPMLSPIMQRRGAPEELIRKIPADPAGFQKWKMENGLGLEKMLEMTAPKVEMVNTGGSIVPTNVNTLAGPVAPIAGAATIQKTTTPGERLSAETTRRGQNLTDARAREPIWDTDRGVFVPRPGAGVGGAGGARPSGPAGAAPAAAPGAPIIPPNLPPSGKAFEREDKLRNDYTANPMVKSSSEMQNAFNIVETAYKRPSAANDLAMATKYMKILDPTSVVRESEFALAVNATGLLDKTLNYADAVLKGQKLNPAQRKDFYESAKAINDAFQGERSKVDQQYSEMAKGYGLDPKNVIPSLRNSAAPKPTTPTPQAKKTIAGKNYVQIDGKWFEE